MAVHPKYGGDPGYQSAKGFLETTLEVPVVPSAWAVGQILHRRVQVALFGESDDREGPAVEDVIETEALEVMFTRYEQAPNVRKHLLLTANAALTFAVDDAADLIEAEHVHAAIAQEGAEGP